MSKKQIAVLVDAGYFFAQATEALFGASRGRHEVEIDEAKTLMCIEEIAKSSFPGRELLRIYWYDAPPSRHVEMSASQERLALKPGVKMRLGTLNGTGQQKGVDALIINDLTQLARDGAADRFVLMSGDEDLRLAVEQAQACGAQVRIMAVGPGNASVGLGLRREVDGIDCFDAELLAECLSARSGSGAEPRAGAGHAAKKAARKGAKPAARGSERPVQQAHASPSQAAQGSARPEGSETSSESGIQEPRGLDGAREPAPSSQAEVQDAHSERHGADHRQQQQEGGGRGKRRRSRGKNRPGRSGEAPLRQNDGPRRDAQEFQVPRASRPEELRGAEGGQPGAAAVAFVSSPAAPSMPEPVVIPAAREAPSPPAKKARAPRKAAAKKPADPAKRARAKKAVDGSESS